VYVAEGLRTPLDGLRAHYTLQPVALDAIEQMVVNTLPKPEYRDALLATGSLYRLRATPLDGTSAAVPAGQERNVAFPQGVTLAGFGANVDTIARGDVVELDYYWRAEREVASDLSAATVFLDANGRVAQRLGIPLWSQIRQIGEGGALTSQWRPGALMHESYFLLVPRTIGAGDYTVAIAVFDRRGDIDVARADAARFVAIGQMTVR
jgi:hypothetical protein